MPTHQGKTQTTILIGDGGESAEMSASLVWEITTSGNAEVGTDDLSGALDVDTASSVTLRDAAGGMLGALHTQLRASATVNGATELTRARTDEHRPLPSGGAARWPRVPETAASRDAWTDIAGLGSLQATFEIATAAGSGVSIDQLVAAQDPGRLEVVLTFRSGRQILAEARVICESSGLSHIDDQFQS